MSATQFPTSPSRAFLVQQATLTAFYERFPASIAFHGRAGWAGKLAGLVRDDFQSGRDFVGHVRAEYAALARRYQVAA